MSSVFTSKEAKSKLGQRVETIKPVQLTGERIPSKTKGKVTAISLLSRNVSLVVVQFRNKYRHLLVAQYEFDKDNYNRYLREL